MRIVAPTLVNLIYSWTINVMPVLAFLDIAGTLRVGVLLTLFLRVGNLAVVRRGCRFLTVDLWVV